jgi:hypothetical protein
VTVCLPNDAAFEALVSHLDRVSRPEGADPKARRVVLGSNRWAPSRMAAVADALAAFPDDFVTALRRLNLVECTWWMHPRHIELIKRHFPTITQIASSTEKLDGTRVDLLLQ